MAHVPHSQACLDRAQALLGRSSSPQFASLYAITLQDEGGMLQS
jgi:hypothetical protein